MNTKHPSSKEIHDVLVANANALISLMAQVKKMQPMFDPSDGAASAALRAGDSAVREAIALGRALDAAAPAHVILMLSEGGISAAKASAPVRVTVLDAELPTDWDAPAVSVGGETWQHLVVDPEVSPGAVARIEAQIEYADGLIEALGESPNESTQEELDNLVHDAVLARFVLEHESLTEDLMAQAESAGSDINNAGVCAQVCEIIASGNLDALRELAGLKPAASSPGAHAEAMTPPSAGMH